MALRGSLLQVEEQGSCLKRKRDQEEFICNEQMLYGEYDDNDDDDDIMAGNIDDLPAWW